MTPMAVYLFPAMWLALSLYWCSMSRQVKANERRESLPSRLVRMIVIVCAAMLLFLPKVPLPLLGDRFLPHGAWCFWMGAAITAIGLLFAVWARRYLGGNWSQSVTVKSGHELITSGPYALVRHPIYTGFLLGFAGSALARGEWRGLLAVILLFSVLWHKLKLEEKWMSAHFGVSYESYARRVSALLPYLF